MTATVFKQVTNNAQSTLPGSMTGAAASLTVQTGDGALFPSSGAFWVTVEDANGAGGNREVMLIGSRAGDVFTITGRTDQALSGQTKGTGIAHAAGSLVRRLWTAGDAQALHTAINGLEGAISYDASGNVGLQITPTYGLHQLGGGLRLQGLQTPSAPTLSGAGTTGGSTTYQYRVVAKDRNGNSTLASSTVQTATGQAALSGGAPIVVTWSAVPAAKTYDVLKLVGALWVSIAGSLGVTGLTYSDTGGATSAYTLPIRNSTADATIDGPVVISDVTALNPFMMLNDGVRSAFVMISGGAMVLYHNNHTAISVDVNGIVTHPTMGDTGSGSAVHATGPTLSTPTLTSPTITGSAVFSTANATLEIGAIGSGANTPSLDFHSSGNNIDYDVRVVVSGGTTTVGQGTINIQSGSFQHNGSAVWTAATLAPPSTAASANTLAQRDGNGYLFSVYFNCTADIQSVSPGYVAGRSAGDTYIRWYYTDFVHRATGGNVALTAQNSLFLVNTGSYVYTPTANDGKRVTIKNITGAAITIYPGSGLIYAVTTGLSSLTCNPGDAYTLVSDGANWFVV